MISFGRKAAAQRRAETFLGAYADNDCSPDRHLGFSCAPVKPARCCE
jgi:hypothetical protein